MGDIRRRQECWARSTVETSPLHQQQRCECERLVRPKNKENAPDSDLSWGVRLSSPPPKSAHKRQKGVPSGTIGQLAKLPVVANNHLPQLQPDDLSSAGRLTGLGELQLGKGIEITPALFFSAPRTWKYTGRTAWEQSSLLFADAKRHFVRASSQTRPHSTDHCADGKNKTSRSVGEQPNPIIVQTSPLH